MSNLYKIRNKKSRLSKLFFNPVQHRILQKILPDWNVGKPLRHFDLKSRQQGVSTFWLLWWFDETIMKSNTVTGVLAHKRESLNYLMNIPRIAYQNMPDRFRPDLVENNKWAMAFGYNSQFFVALSIRSVGVHNLHISEWCWCEDEEVQASIGAASPSTNITGETTGNGVGNDGYRTYQNAKIADSEFSAMFHPWFLSPEYKNELQGMTFSANEKEQRLCAKVKAEFNLALSPEQLLWRRYTELKLKSIFKQEYPETEDDAFRTSGHKFFDYKKIHALIMEAKEFLKTRKPVAQTDDFVQFEEANKYKVYAAGADTGEGGGDYSVLKIINVTDQIEAFVYRARCGVDVFYRVCNQWCRYFKNALLAVESNNHGHAVILGLEENAKYPNLYKDMGTTRLRVDQAPKVKTGWTTNASTRPIMLDELKWAIEGDSDEDEEHFTPEFTVIDIALLKELLTFSEKDGKFEAEAGEHDDDIMASAIAYQMYKRLRKYVRPLVEHSNGNGNGNGHREEKPFGILAGVERETKI